MSSIDLPKTKRNLIVAVMLVSAFVAILNQTLLNTALPHIMRELKIDESTSQWLITGFMLVNGVMIPLTAFLMDRVKTRPLYLGAMGTFLLGSIVAAVAPNFGVLMTARVIQAIGAGVLMPLMQFTLFTLFSKEHRGFAMGLAGLVIQFAPAIGPTFTGLIIDVIVLKQKILPLNTLRLSNGLEIVSCLLTNIEIIIILMINDPITIGLEKPKFPALLNAYSIIPKPIVEYTTERLSNFESFVSL